MFSSPLTAARLVSLIVEQENILENRQWTARPAAPSHQLRHAYSLFGLEPPLQQLPAPRRSRVRHRLAALPPNALGDGAWRPKTRPERCICMSAILTSA